MLVPPLEKERIADHRVTRLRGVTDDVGRRRRVYDPPEAVASQTLLDIPVLVRDSAVDVPA